MVQRLKSEVRQRILAAAEAEFARAGYRGATMAAIARSAGVATGNLYRYYKGKDELFYTLFTDAFASSFLATLRRRVGSLTATDDLRALDESATRDGEDLLSFWIANRLRVVVLLSRAEGSRYQDFPERFIDALMQPTLALLCAESGTSQLSPVVHTTLHTIFDNTVRAIVATLSAHDTEAAIREAFAAFWSYQLAGLDGFRKWVRHA